MAPKKSIYRRDGAQHFQLVHRSQRDPLINDSEAGQQVLKPVGRPNDRKVGPLPGEMELMIGVHAIGA
jgi:protein LTV1